jgi:hypothetical protein
VHIFALFECECKGILVMFSTKLNIILFIFLFLSIPISNQHKPTPITNRSIDVQFFSDSGIELKQLSEGKSGEGWLLYYAPGTNNEYPILVVNLFKEDAQSPAIAEIYMSSTSLNYIPIRVEADRVTLNQSHKPAIKMIAPGGWWQKNGITNFNLEVLIYGPIYAMWGGGYDRTSGPLGWTALIDPQELGVQISVGDKNRDGIPDWELRSIVPKFRGRGDYRSNYAERKCDSPIKIDNGVSPLWPFVATKGDYEQPPGQLRPPIVVDWRTGKITHFSELVTVRNQNCSYAFYTINPLEIERINKVNFEAPIATYDLSRQGNGYPNMLIRTERYPAGDRWFNQSSVDFETIRYSWRNAVGDGRWDYKIEVAGFHRYESQTSIAGDLLAIDAPSYEQFPQWVIERKWPVVTFVDTLGSLDRSSEGIYAWSPRQLGDEYLRGEAELPNPDAFSTIQPGWRGEYQHTKNLHPKLYLSPIDNNLHLLGAEAGIQNIGNSTILRLDNLDNDLYIDSWTKEVFKGKFNGESFKSPDWETQEAIYAVGEYLIFSGIERVEILRTEIPRAILEIDPPTNYSTWLSFQDLVESKTVGEKDPLNLASWLGGFSGEIFNISGASISNVRVLPNGFQFMLELQSDYQETSTKELLPIENLATGKYLVRHEGGFNIKPIIQAQLTLDIGYSRDELLTGNPILLKLDLENLGLETLDRLVLIVTAKLGEEKMEIFRCPVDAMGGELQEYQITWQPIKPGTWRLNAKLENSERDILADTKQEIEVSSREASGSEVLSLSSKFPLQEFLVGFCLLAFVAQIIQSAGFVEFK